MDEQQLQAEAQHAEQNAAEQADIVVGAAPPERSDFEALASRVLALAQHGEHYTLDLIDAAVHRVHPEDVEAKAKRIAARVLSLVGADGWWHHANIDAAVTLAESQTGGTPK